MRHASWGGLLATGLVVAGCQALSGLSGLDPGPGAGGGGATSVASSASATGGSGGTTSAAGGALNSSSAGPGGGGGGSGGGEVPLDWTPLAAEHITCTGDCGVTALSVSAGATPTLTVAGFFSGVFGGPGGSPSSPGVDTWGTWIQRGPAGGDLNLVGSLIPTSAGSNNDWAAVPVGVVVLPNNGFAVAINFKGQVNNAVFGDIESTSSAGDRTWDGMVWFHSELGGQSIDTFAAITSTGDVQLRGLRANATGTRVLVYGQHPEDATLLDATASPITLAPNADSSALGFALELTTGGVYTNRIIELRGPNPQAVRAAAYDAEDRVALCARVDGDWEVADDVTVSGSAPGGFVLLRETDDGIWHFDVAPTGSGTTFANCDALDIGPSGEMAVTMRHLGLVQLPPSSPGGAEINAMAIDHEISNLLLTPAGEYVGHGLIALNTPNPLGPGFPGNYALTGGPMAGNVITDHGEVFVGHADQTLGGDDAVGLDAYFLSFLGASAMPRLETIPGFGTQALLAASANHGMGSVLVIGGTFNGDIVMPGGGDAAATGYDAMFAVLGTPVPVE